MSSDVTSTFKRVPAGQDNKLWNGEPGLPLVADQTYGGRVFVEVWDNDIRLGITGEPQLADRALAALRGNHIRADEALLPWPHDPATGIPSGQAFLGRLVVELWSRQAVVNVTGQSPQQVLERATQRLIAFVQTNKS